MKLKNKAKRNERMLAFQQSAAGRGGAEVLCRLFTERADGFCHRVVPSKQQPQGTLQGAEPAAASNFLNTLATFQCQMKTKKMKRGLLIGCLQ